MRIKEKSILCISTVALLVGCATNTANIKQNESTLSSSTNAKPSQAVGNATTGQVLIVPVGDMNANFTSNSGFGAAFGLIGALVEAAATAGNSNSQSSTAKEVLVEQRLQDYLASEVAKSLQKCGYRPDISAEIYAKDTKNWADTDAPLSGSLVNVKPNYQYLIEVGIQDLSVQKTLVQDRIHGSAVAKLYRSNNLEFVEKFRDFTAFSGKAVLQHYSSDDNNKKIEELKNGSKSVLNYLAGNIASDICSYEKPNSGSSQSSYMPQIIGSDGSPVSNSVKTNSKQGVSARASDNKEPSSRLKALNKLKAEGLISDQEYQQKKAQILNQM